MGNLLPPKLLALLVAPRAPDTGTIILTQGGALLKLVMEVQRQHEQVCQDVIHRRVGLQEKQGPGASALGLNTGDHSPAPGQCSATTQLGDPEQVHCTSLSFCFLIWRAGAQSSYLAGLEISRAKGLAKCLAWADGGNGG